MKIAIHQPNYLPWIGYFDKLDQVDKFVLLDTAIHSKREFVNRNKIKTPQGDIWLTVPLKTKEIPINETLIDNSLNWKDRHWKMIESNYKKSKYWNDYKEGFEQIYSKEWEEISPLNIALIKYIKNVLNIKTDMMLESDFQKDFGKGNMRNVNIVKHLEGDIYVSGTGARAYNDKSEFNNNQIKLEYQVFKHPEYPQRWRGFLPNLSMIDMIFNCGHETIEIIRKQRQQNEES